MYGRITEETVEFQTQNAIVVRVYYEQNSFDEALQVVIIPYRSEEEKKTALSIANIIKNTL